MKGRLADWVVALAGSDVSPTALRVGCAFVRWARIELDGELRPSVAALVRESNVSERHAHRALKELRAEGWVKVVGMHEETRCNVYALTIPVSGESRHPGKSRHHGETRSNEGGGSRQNGGGETGDPNAEVGNTEENTEDPPVATAPVASPASPTENQPTGHATDRPDTVRSGEVVAPTPTHTSAPNAKREPKPKAPAVDTRPVTDAWDVAWAKARRQPVNQCPRECENAGRPKCKAHWPGYPWPMREIQMARAALKNGWTVERIVRLMGHYHADMGAMPKAPRSFPGFYSRLADLEARHPAPVVLPAPAVAPVLDLRPRPDAPPPPPPAEPVRYRVPPEARIAWEEMTGRRKRPVATPVEPEMDPALRAEIEAELAAARAKRGIA